MHCHLITSHPVLQVRKWAQENFINDQSFSMNTGFTLHPSSVLVTLSLSFPQLYNGVKCPSHRVVRVRCDACACKEHSIVGTSIQDGGVGRHASPPHATTRRITIKSQNDVQNFQKIKLWKSNDQGFKEATFIQVGAFYRESKQLYLIHRNKHRKDVRLRSQRNMAQMKEQQTPRKRTK